MRLEYRILWFDDQPANTRYHRDRISSALSRFGFDPRIETPNIPPVGSDPFAGLPSAHEVDLILMDWKLGGGQNGAALARSLRQSFRDTDIVFYSSETPHRLRELIFQQEIDGVHCFGRTTLCDRTIGLIKSQMRKVMDLNHMRGIVMAATSDLDQDMIACLEVLQAVSYPDEPAAFAADISEKVSYALRRKAEEVDRMGRNGRLAKLLHEPSFGSAMRLAVLQAEMAKLGARINEAHLLEGLGRYQGEVIGPRNDFAHRRAVVEAGRLVLEGREQVFDQDSMATLRLTLLNHADNLRALLSLLREMAGPAWVDDAAARLEAIAGDVQETVVEDRG